MDDDMPCKRIRYIDIARGIAMILVIIGHCDYTNEQVRVWLYSFHMPLFFVISGLTFSINNKANIKEMIKDKFKKLLIPYFILSIILWILVVTIVRNFRNISIKELIGILIGYRLTPYYFSMWFILVLFLTEIVAYNILKKMENLNSKTINYAVIIISLVSVFLGVFVNKYVKGFIWSLDLVPFGLGFFMMGQFIKINIKFFKSKVFKFYFLPIFLMVNLIFTYSNYLLHGRTDLYLCNTGNYFLFLISSVSGVLFIIIESYYLRYNKILEYVGKNSIVFYAFQNSFVIPLVTKNVLIFIRNFGILHVPAIIVNILIIIITLLVLAIMNEFIDFFILLIKNNSFNNTQIFNSKN